MTDMLRRSSEVFEDGALALPGFGMSDIRPGDEIITTLPVEIEKIDCNLTVKRSGRYVLKVTEAPLPEGPIIGMLSLVTDVTPVQVVDDSVREDVHRGWHQTDVRSFDYLMHLNKLPAKMDSEPLYKFWTEQNGLVRQVMPRVVTATWLNRPSRDSADSV